MKVLWGIFVLFIGIDAHGKQYEVRFEESCFSYYGEDVRQEIIDKTLKNWNEVPSTPIKLVQGPDLEVEVDHTNVNDYLWDPTGLAPGFHPLPFAKQDLDDPFIFKTDNVVVCDEDGRAMNEITGIPYTSDKINGFAGKRRHPYYDHFAIYINESHGIVQNPVENWQEYPKEWRIPGGRLTKNQMIALLTHELGHILGLGHVSMEYGWKDGVYQLVTLPFEEDYPCMFGNIFNSTGELQPEDIAEHRRVIKHSDFGEMGEFSFSAKVRSRGENLYTQDFINALGEEKFGYELTHKNYTFIDLKIEWPHPIRGKDLEFLAVAVIDSESYYYKDKTWHPWDGEELSGLEFNAFGYSKEVEVFDGKWLLTQEIELFWGVRYEGEIYYTETPMLISPKAGGI